MDSSKITKYLVEEAKLYKWSELFLDNQNPNNTQSFDFKRVSENLPINDVQSGDLFYNKLNLFLSFIPGENRWYAWDGKIHVPCTDDTVVKSIIEAFYKELETTLNSIDTVISEAIRVATSAGGTGEDDDRVKKLKKNKDLFKKPQAYADRIGNSSGIDSLVKLLKTKLSKSDKHFEEDQRWLVCRNCVFDLDLIRNYKKNHADTVKRPLLIEGVVLTHSPERNVTRLLDVDYDPSLSFEDSHWIDFLTSSVSDGDKDTIEHLQKVTGASFMGEHSLRTMINLVGPPGSGKSLYTGTFHAMSPEGYSASPESSALVKVQGQNFAQDFFRRKRFIMISEPPLGEQIDDDFLKKFTGDSSVATRTLNDKGGNWTPQGTLFIASNDTLRINSRDRAIVDRMQVVKFPYSFVDRPDGPNQKLINRDLGKIFTRDESEKSRILNWVLVGMELFVLADRSLDPPASIQAERSKVMSSGTSSLRWLNDVLEDSMVIDIIKTPVDFQINDGSYIAVDECYRMYKLWCAENGERTAQKRFFVHDIERSYPIMKYGTKKLFKGLVKPNDKPEQPSFQINPGSFEQKSF